MSEDIITAKELQERLESRFDDFEFYYKGKHGSVCPFDEDAYSLYYDGKDKTFHDAATLMHDKFLDGKSLYEVAEELAPA